MTTIMSEDKHFVMDLLSKIQSFSLTGQTYNNIMELQHTSKTKTCQQNNHNLSNFVKENDVAKKSANVAVNDETKTIDNTRTLYSVKARDQLFWCLLMISRGWEEADLPEQRDRFTFESNEKTMLTELLQKSKSIPWKELKLSKSGVCSSLGASINKTINVDILRALAFLYEKNIAFIMSKNCCVRICGGRANISDQKWYVIFRKRSGYTLATDEYAERIMKVVDAGEYYIVEDPNKPLMAISAYKLGDLQDTAGKLGINIYRTNDGKAKLKKDLYQEIIDVIHKID